MARRLTHEESRAIKRTMRATPKISQRMHDGWLADDGRFVIKAGKPPIGQLLAATKSNDGKWSVEVVDMWQAGVSDSSRQSSAGRNNDQKTVQVRRRFATPNWRRPTWLAVVFGGAVLRCPERRLQLPRAGIGCYCGLVPIIRRRCCRLFHARDPVAISSSNPKTI